MNPQNSPTPSVPAGEPGAGGGATDTSGTLTDTKNKISQSAREAATKARTAATNTVTRAKAEAERFAAEKKETTATKIRDYSSAIHESARSLEEKDPNIAWFTHQAADKLQGVADYMRNRDFTALRYDAENMARRHPGTFFGGMFLAGLIIGNLVKASRRKLDETPEYAGDMGNETDWSQPGMNEPQLTDAERSAAGI
jgi:hypothetical protein